MALSTIVKKCVGTWKMNNKVMLIVTEGETDEEFYKKILEYIKLKGNIDKFPFNKIDFICARGIGNLQNKIIRSIKNKLYVSQEMSDVRKTIVLCYDLDVFEYNQNPPIDRKYVIEEIKRLGDCSIITIEAKQTIEDFFLFDFEGIKKFLRLKKTYKLKRKGYQGLKQMFRDCGKTYFKGEKVEGLIQQLNMDIIFENIKNDLRDFCAELGYIVK